MIENRATSAETEKCLKCGKVKRLKTAVAEVITKQNVRTGDNQVLSQDRDETRSQAIKWKNQTQQRTSSPPLLAKKGMVSYQPREQKYRPPQDAMLPTLMKIEPSRVKARRNQDSVVNSRNSMISGAHRNFQRSRRRSTTSSSTSVASSQVNYSASSTEDHRKYQRSRGRSTSSSSLYSASSTGSLTQTTNYSMSSTSSEESDAPPQRTMQLDRHCKCRSISRSRPPQTHYTCSNRSSTSMTSYNSSPEEYPVRRRNRFSKVHPPQKKRGHLRRLTNKLAGMFRHDHRDDRDASSSKEDRNAHDHHLFVQKHVVNGKLHRKSKEKPMQMQMRRTAAV